MADDNPEKYSCSVIIAMKKNFYVDDALPYENDEQSAIRLAHDMVDLPARGGFNSTKFTSNSKRLLKGGNFIYPMMHCFILHYQVLISSTGTQQLNNGGKRLVLPIKPSVPLLCRSIYDFRSTIPNISLVKSKRVFGRRLLVNYCN